jgi:hypothetical protein
MITLLGMCNKRFIKDNKNPSRLFRIENSTLNPSRSGKTSSLPSPSIKPTIQYIETTDFISSELLFSLKCDIAGET